MAYALCGSRHTHAIWHMEYRLPIAVLAVSMAIHYSRDELKLCLHAIKRSMATQLPIQITDGKITFFVAPKKPIRSTEIDW